MIICYIEVWVYLYIDRVFFSIQSVVVKECHTLLANADHTFFLPWAMSSLPLFCNTVIA